MPGSPTIISRLATPVRPKSIFLIKKKKKEWKTDDVAHLACSYSRCIQRNGFNGRSRISRLSTVRKKSEGDEKLSGSAEAALSLLKSLAISPKHPIWILSKNEIAFGGISWNYSAPRIRSHASSLAKVRRNLEYWNFHCRI